MGNYWQGKSAIVTGAASGIGLALSRALVQRGVTVWMADIDGAKVAEAARELGVEARATTLDVCDAAAVQALVTQVVAAQGRIDFMFNNAGIGIAGEVQELSVAHFDRIIDINVRGVVNGTLAAYPQMVQQKGGHIVNTASLSGLVPTALLVPYTMTKHAVVGFTAGLRLEAAAHKVCVSAICPAAVETPLLDAQNPADLAGARRVWRPDVRAYLTELAGAPYPVDRLAQEALKGIENNQALIILPAQAKVVAWLYRMFPALVGWVSRRSLAKALAGRK